MAGHDMQPIRDWLQQLNDNYLSTWANRGLLRRGKKLFDKLDAESLSWEPHPSASIDGYQQQLTAATVDTLECNCPAAGPCHHLIAFVLYLQQDLKQDSKTLTENESVDTNNAVVQEDKTDEHLSATSSWMLADIRTLESLLGRPLLRRACQQLEQGVIVHSEKLKQQLQFSIELKKTFHIHISLTQNVESVVCSCGQRPCIHLALAVLSYRLEHEFNDCQQYEVKAISETQAITLNQIQDSLLNLVARGQAGLSQTIIEQTQVLSTQAKQADLPAVARQLNALIQVLNADHQQQAVINSQLWRQHLAGLWARIRALQSTPLPQPLKQLTGEHKRHYRIRKQLLLQGVGAEAWHSDNGYRGISLYLYAPAESQWYCYTELRSPHQVDFDWSPSVAYQESSWAGIPLQQIAGAGIHCHQLWCSEDRQISDREGAKLSLTTTPNKATDDLPITTHYLDLPRIISKLQALDPTTFTPRQAIIVQVSEFDKPSFNSSQSCWEQYLYDAKGNQLLMLIELNKQHAQKAMKQLNTAFKRRQKLDLVFGFLECREHNVVKHRRSGEKKTQSKSQQIIIRPVSVQFQNQATWKHLTL